MGCLFNIAHIRMIEAEEDRLGVSSFAHVKKSRVNKMLPPRQAREAADDFLRGEYSS
jgi:hypothetical protein